MRIAKIFTFGFALIFCAVGIVGLYGAATSLQDGVTRETIVMLIAGLAFSGAGVAVILIAAAGFRAKARRAVQLEAHPGEPWMWREDWAAGQVYNSERNIAWSIWGFAILWNLISMPLLFFLPEEIIEKENYPALFGLLFPLVGLGLIVFALRKTIQRRKFGNSLFQMDRVPGALGGEVAGFITIPRGLTTAETLTVQLSCIRRTVQRSGKSTSTSEDVLWQTEQSVLRLSPMGGEAAQGVRVSFRVPYDALPTDESDPNNAIIWRLDTAATVPGVDFAAKFDVPVFKTADSSPEITEEHLRTEEVSREGGNNMSIDSTSVHVVLSAEGGTEFVLKPCKGTKGAAPALVIAAIFLAIAAFLGYAGAPSLFPLVFGGFGLLMTLFVVFGAFGESRILVENGYISVRNYLFGLMTGRRVRCSNIVKIGVKGQAQAGKQGYYSIILTQQNGKTLSPLQFLPEKRQADWLAEEVRKVMEPWRNIEHPEGTVADRSGS